MTAWMRCYWDEEDVWFYFELDTAGWVTRQVEFQGPRLHPVAAASLVEWQQARDAGRLAEYDSRFGITAQSPVAEWEGHDQHPLTCQEFEEAWDRARRQLAGKP
ncbi:hypothetical protein [Streptomyces sp. NPDC059063]|uniref:hypothetical protein n=1 Tax=unclassified Streptomyces TaxID=2593676 RepID=UPI00367FB1F2